MTLTLTNGTVLALPTTGYWPYSGDSGPAGVTAPIHDAGSYEVSDVTELSVVKSLSLTGISKGE